MTTLGELLAPVRAHRRTVATLAAVLLVTFGYFVPAPAWNQNSRFALTRALVERGSTIIDADHETTGDKSLRDGHFYCDKAPGASFAAALPYALWYLGNRLIGGELPAVSVIPLDPRDASKHIEPADRRPGDRLAYNRAHRIALWFCGLASVGVASVASAVAVWLMALRVLARSVAAACACALVYALATPVFPYSTALYGHQLCGALLVCALALVGLAERGRLDRNAALLAGLATAGAVVTEYPAAVPAIAMTLLVAWRHRTPALAWFLVGALPLALVLAAYHTAAFGDPLRTGYDFVYLPEFAEGMRERYGIARPDPHVLLEIGFGSYRGLFYLAPVLLLAVWGLGVRLCDRDDPMRDAIAFACVTVVFFVLLNAGYYMWDGGAAIGPRHVVPMLGALALGLPPALRMVPHAFAALAVVSAAQMLLATAAMPEAPQWGNPLWEFALGHVLGREASTDALASNLGLLLGLPGVLSLIPLAVLWAWAWPLVRGAIDGATED